MGCVLLAWLLAVLTLPIARNPSRGEIPRLFTSSASLFPPSLDAFLILSSPTHSSLFQGVSGESSGALAQESERERL